MRVELYTYVNSDDFIAESGYGEIYVEYDGNLIFYPQTSIDVRCEDDFECDGAYFSCEYPTVCFDKEDGFIYELNYNRENGKYRINNLDLTMFKIISRILNHAGLIDENNNDDIIELDLNDAYKLNSVIEVATKYCGESRIKCVDIKMDYMDINEWIDEKLHVSG